MVWTVVCQGMDFRRFFGVAVGTWEEGTKSRNALDFTSTPALPLRERGQEDAGLGE